MAYHCALWWTGCTTCVGEGIATSWADLHIFVGYVFKGLSLLDELAEEYDSNIQSPQFIDRLSI